ncbi:Hsp20/alpha crystallin family protein [Chrysiogenes arsenatis]|uniref:Hsp20/alpha crystallin family protein n=1 Tax=Chrysiogenes arsenatis TaxID=309797 RepID=UPI0003F9E170|nr:Hsp20/alpha crystallin family protein [Chrysiogenes arsenatis]
MSYLNILNGMDMLMKDFDFAVRPRTSRNLNGYDTTYPAMNLYEDEEAYCAELSCPGIAKENIDMNVNKNMLTVELERKPISEEGVEYSRRERRIGKFKRSITLNGDIDTEKISAHYIDGILKIRIPKAEHTKARKIAISQ